ncbi:MAG: MFS transporter [Candidatus Woesebacteria bacterium]
MHQNIRIFRWFNFFTDFRLYAPVAILYFTKVSGSFTLGMTVFSVAMVSSALFEIPTGIFSDRIGRKRTVICGALASILSIVLYAMSGNFLMLAFGAVFEGLARSFYSGNNEAFLHDSLTHDNEAEDFSEHYGKISSMFQIALALSAVVGGIIAYWSFAAVMWISVIPQVICFILSLFLIDIKVVEKGEGNIYVHLAQAFKDFIGNPKLRALSIADIFSYALGESGYLFQSAFYQTIWPVWAIGIAKVLSNLGAATSFHYSGKLLRKYNAFALVMWGAAYSRVVTILATLFPSILSPLLLASGSLWFGVTNVAKETLMQKEYTASKRATMGSLNSFGGSLLFGIAATTLGFFADKFSPAQALFGIQIVALTVLWMYWRMFKKYGNI